MVDWTEKYRPASLSEVRGNDTARDALAEWAETWPDHREAVVVHGSPGIGKTSAAHALANDAGWDVVELNASDQRTADVVERVAGEAARSGTLTGGSGGRKLVLLDEADNLHGNIDRGGSAAITRLVDDAPQPIVLVANEYYEMSSSLRSACREIEFRDVSKRSIVPVLRDVCRREDVTYEEDALAAIAEQNAGDLRSAVNDLQALAEQDRTLTADDVVMGERDRTEGVFDYLDDVIATHSAREALQAAYDVDETPDDLLSWVADNVPKDYRGGELADAYEFLSNADVWLGRVRATQNYAYWRYATDNVAAGVAAARRHDHGGWTRYGPPSYWRKLGSSRATREKRDYVARHIAETAGCSMATARNDVLPFLRVLTHHCKNRELTVAMTAAYELDTEHVAFVTGSGETTNKVASIVADAEERRTDAAVDHSEGAFAGAVREDSTDEDSAADETTDDDEDTEADSQRGLDEFF
ncbi:MULTISPECIES: replication factor C large subunit [Halobacterium]|uniref:replication factor C large subunit n=1 Tax=Halobacterium TaxID=2239 RepID=UPI0019624411|nr:MULTISPECIES: replication factor C large subunit [Halobacterium]MCF2207468.1 replication factor C large subunit [Halobacterium salinarum]MDL0125374.1 replication factor C large subunit [Halobacterium salinarum]MDL0136252.1 replication factor C large subunit [Halobacterium salinarum]QRY24028.1 replication factor C large subunit [Halobacterium sp. BOL4-2]